MPKFKTRSLTKGQVLKPWLSGKTRFLEEANFLNNVFRRGQVLKHFLEEAKC